MTDHDKLRELAQAADGGEYYAEGNRVITKQSYPELGGSAYIPLADFMLGDTSNRDFYIAANPAAVLSLLAELAQLRQSLAAAEAGGAQLRAALIEVERYMGIVRANSRHIPASLDGVLHDGMYAIHTALTATAALAAPARGSEQP